MVNKTDVCAQAQAIKQNGIKEAEDFYQSILERVQAKIKEFEAEMVQAELYSKLSNKAHYAYKSNPYDFGAKARYYSLRNRTNDAVGKVKIKSESVADLKEYAGKMSSSVFMAKAMLG